MIQWTPKFFPAQHLKKLVLPSLLILVSLVALDQYSKRHMQHNLLFHADKQDTTVYQGKKDVVFAVGERKSWYDASEFYFGFNFHYSRNPGAAFGMFANLPEHLRKPFFHFMSLVALFVSYFLFMGSRPQSWLLRLGIVFILSGAIGNFLDRVLLGYVIDFIDFEWHVFGWKHDFAVFNIADIALNVGVFLLVFDIIREWKWEAKEQASSETSM